MTDKFLIGLTILLSVFFCACGDEESDIKAGKLSKSSWVYKDSYSSSVSAYDYTYTFKFTSDKAGTATQTGWAQVIDAKTWKMGPKQNVNKSQDFTYIYSPELKQGVITFTSKGIFTKGDHIFTISDNVNDMKWGSNTYKRQK